MAELLADERISKEEREAERFEDVTVDSSLTTL